MKIRKSKRIKYSKSISPYSNLNACFTKIKKIQREILLGKQPKYKMEIGRADRFTMYTGGTIQGLDGKPFSPWAEPKIEINPRLWIQQALK